MVALLKRNRPDQVEEKKPVVLKRNKPTAKVPLLKRNSADPERQKLLDQSKAVAQNPKKVYVPINVDNIVSTGSTLLDLVISGGRVRGGGIPGGIMIEIFGPNSCGKTALMVEMGASVQDKGGDIDIIDPEGRLDKEYTRTYGLELPKNRYYRMDLVEEVFNWIRSWSPTNPNVLNMVGVDSIAALSTELEMGEKGDKRGQKKAKDLHSGCRKIARLIAEDNKLVVFTNQQLDGEYGATTSGGKAVGFYSSLRLQIYRKKRIEKDKDFKYDTKKVKVTKSIGIHSIVTVIKSSIDDEARKADIYIIAGVGIDDVRANLQYLKTTTGATVYECLDGKTYVAIEDAIRYVETNDLESLIREKVIDVWEMVEEKFKTKRKKKVRF